MGNSVGLTMQRAAGQIVIFFQSHFDRKVSVSEQTFKSFTVS